MKNEDMNRKIFLSEVQTNPSMPTAGPMLITSRKKVCLECGAVGVLDDRLFL